MNSTTRKRAAALAAIAAATAALSSFADLDDAAPADEGWQSSDAPL